MAVHPSDLPKGSSAGSLSSPSPSSSPWRAHLVRAADGDSFTARRADTGQTVELRLYGVDAPENGQPYGQASRRSLLAMTEGKILTVSPVENDRYGRVVAVVFAAGDETSVNERQLEQGMAWYYGAFVGRRSAKTGRPRSSGPALNTRGCGGTSAPKPPTSGVGNIGSRADLPQNAGASRTEDGNAL